MDFEVKRSAVIASPQSPPASSGQRMGYSDPDRIPAGFRGEKPAPASGDQPAVLGAVFGDRDGVHVIWKIPSENHNERTFEHRYSPESDLAGRLNDCYAHLAQAGYKIVGLDLARMRTVAPEKKSPQISPEKSAVAAPGAKPAPSEDPKKVAETKQPTWVVRLLPRDARPIRPGPRGTG